MVTGVQSLSDANLDAAFAVCWDQKYAPGVQMYGDEIRTRLQSVAMWWTGILGHSSFPLYDERLARGYGISGQVDSARQSVTDSAAALPSTVATAVSDAAKKGLAAAGGGAVVGLAIVAVVAYLYLNRGKL